MKVVTGRMISIVVSRPPDSANSSTEPSTITCRKSGRFALVDQRDVLRELLQERGGDERVEMLRGHVPEQRQFAHELEVGPAHALVYPHTRRSIVQLININ